MRFSVKAEKRICSVGISGFSAILPFSMLYLLCKGGKGNLESRALLWVHLLGIAQSYWLLPVANQVQFFFFFSSNLASSPHSPLPTGKSKVAKCGRYGHVMFRTFSNSRLKEGI